MFNIIIYIYYIKYIIFFNNSVITKIERRIFCYFDLDKQIVEERDPKFEPQI